jgi:hypothetical protein
VNGLYKDDDADNPLVKELKLDELLFNGVKLSEDIKV